MSHSCDICLVHERPNASTFGGPVGMHYEVVYCNMDKKVAPGSSWKHLIRLYLPIVAVGSLWKFMENANDRFQELLSATVDLLIMHT